jgi:hypothetical protein
MEAVGLWLENNRGPGRKAREIDNRLKQQAIKYAKSKDDFLRHVLIDNNFNAYQSAQFTVSLSIKNRLMGNFLSLKTFIGWS